MTGANAYRVWNVINPPGYKNYYGVYSPEEAALVIERWSKHQLTVPGIWGNVFGLEVYKDGEWQEWYLRDGDSISDLLDKING